MVPTIEEKREEEKGSDDVENGEPLELDCFLSKLLRHEEWPAHLRQDEECEDTREVEEEVAEGESEGRPSSTNGESGYDGGGRGPEVGAQGDGIGSLQGEDPATHQGHQG